MKQSILVLSEQLFDYAGLFPPAKLPLENALTSYMNYQEGAYRKMLGKFILPATRCIDTVSFFNTFRTKREPLCFSLLFSQAKSSTELESSFYHELANIEFLAHHSHNKWLISSFEIKFPFEFYDFEKDKLFSLLDVLIERLKLVSNVQKDFEFFCEIPFMQEKQLSHFLSSIDKYNSSRTQKIFLKLRTGGVTPESIPKALNLSETIYCLGKFLIPFKVTAGLHVPVPNFNPDVNAKMHGFLNVILASMLAFQMSSHGLTSAFSIASLEDILINLNYEHLNVQDTSIELQMPSDPDKKIVFENSKIHKFRKNYFRGIGTCDFLEPIEYLGEHFS